jgi:hypothetical protein
VRAQIHERLSSVVFANAIVLVTGESFFTNRVAGLAGFPLHSLFTAVFGAPVWPYGSDTPLGLVEKDAWRTIFMNTRQNDQVGHAMLSAQTCPLKGCQRVSKVKGCKSSEVKYMYIKSQTRHLKV